MRVVEMSRQHAKSILNRSSRAITDDDELFPGERVGIVGDGMFMGTAVIGTYTGVMYGRHTAKISDGPARLHPVCDTTCMCPICFDWPGNDECPTCHGAGMCKPFAYDSAVGLPVLEHEPEVS